MLKAPPVKAPSFEQRWSAWGGAYGGSNRTSGDPAVIGSHDLSASTAGFAGGLDYRLTPDTVVGFALAGGGTNWSLANGLGGGKSDAFQAGVYGATRWGAAYLAAALPSPITGCRPTASRLPATISPPASTRRASARGWKAAIASRPVRRAHALRRDPGAELPHAELQRDRRQRRRLRACLYRSHRTDTRSELGARFDRLLALNPNAVLTLRARLAWAHDWVSDPALAAAFQALPGASFIVNGATPAKNSALASAGTELRLANGFTLLGKFDGEFAPLHHLCRHRHHAIFVVRPVSRAQRSNGDKCTQSAYT